MERLCLYMFNTLPNDKILDRFKLEAYVDDKIKVTGNLKVVLSSQR